MPAAAPYSSPRSKPPTRAQPYPSPVSNNSPAHRVRQARREGEGEAERGAEEEDEEEAGELVCAVRKVKCGKGGQGELFVVVGRVEEVVRKAAAQGEEVKSWGELRKEKVVGVEVRGCWLRWDELRIEEMPLLRHLILHTVALDLSATSRVLPTIPLLETLVFASTVSNRHPREFFQTFSKYRPSSLAVVSSSKGSSTAKRLVPAHSPQYTSPLLDLSAPNRLLTQVRFLAAVPAHNTLGDSSRKRLEGLAVDVEQVEEEIRNTADVWFDRLDVLRLALPNRRPPAVEIAAMQTAIGELRPHCDEERMWRNVGGGQQEHFRLGSYFPVLRRVILPHRLNEHDEEWEKPEDLGTWWEETEGGDADGERLLAEVAVAFELERP